MIIIHNIYNNVDVGQVFDFKIYNLTIKLSIIYTYITKYLKILISYEY